MTTTRMNQNESSGKTTSAGTPRQKMLVVEDDAETQRTIEEYFRQIGFDVLIAGDGETGMKIALEARPAAVILDLMLPKLDGLSVCRQLREKLPLLPIIILTAKADVADKVVGLELGADDYMTKPFSLRELEARLKSVMRRTQVKASARSEEEPEPIICGKMRIDAARREVSIDGRSVDLTPKEFELLSLFATHPGRVYSRKYLLENIWDYTYSGYDRTIDSHINRLRAKIEQDPDNPKMILTVWGVGYKFAGD